MLKALRILVALSGCCLCWILIGGKFKLFRVSSGSMEATLYAGDIVLAEDLTGELRTFIKANDILLFNFPLNNAAVIGEMSGSMLLSEMNLNIGEILECYEYCRLRTNASRDVYIKRCFGLPGDTLRLVDNQLGLKNPQTRMQTRVRYQNEYSFHFPLFTHNIRRSDFEIVVPKSGMDIHLDSSSVNLYYVLLTLYEGHEIGYADGSFFIDGVKTNRVSVKNDYYFVIGDNYDHSYDSRNFGFIPRANLLARVTCVLFSSDTNQ